MFPVRVPYSHGYPGYKKIYPYRGRRHGTTRRARKVSYNNTFPFLLGQVHVVHKPYKGQVDDEILAYHFNPYIHYIKYPHNEDTYYNNEGEYFVVLDYDTDKIIEIYRYEIV